MNTLHRQPTIWALKGVLAAVAVAAWSVTPAGAHDPRNGVKEQPDGWHSGLVATADLIVRDHQLVSMAAPYFETGARLSFTFGGCFGGGMIDELQEAAHELGGNVSANSASQWDECSFYSSWPNVVGYTDAWGMGATTTANLHDVSEIAIEQDDFSNLNWRCETPAYWETGPFDLEKHGGNGYAILWSGDPLAAEDGRELDWLYQLLVAQYGYARAKIWVLYGDGVLPGGFGGALPPLPGNVHPATEWDLSDVWNGLFAEGLGPDDIVVFFANDHGALECPEGHVISLARGYCQDGDACQVTQAEVQDWICEHRHEPVDQFVDAFDGPCLDWYLVLDNVDTYDAGFADGMYTVSDIGPAEPGWARLKMSRSAITDPDDFSVTLDVRWTEDSLANIQDVRIQLIDEPGSTVIAQAAVYDAWSNDYPWGMGRIESGPMGWTADSLPLNGTATLQIRVRGEMVEIYVNGELVKTGTTTYQAAQVRVLISNYDEPPDNPYPFGTISLDRYVCTGWSGPCPGDLDEDGDTDQSDLGVLLADWGCTGGNCPGDLDADGDTDQSDLGILLADWGCMP